MSTRSNTYAGTCTACGTTVDAGAGTVEKLFGSWVTTHTTCTPTAITFDEAAVRFGITAREVEDIINLTDPGSDELDDDTLLISQSGVRFIEQALAARAERDAIIAAQSAKFAAALAATKTQP